MSSDRKRLRELCDDLEAQGFRLRHQRRGSHIIVTRPGGPGSATLPGSSSDHRAMENTLSDLRKQFGYVAPWKQPASSSER